MSDFQQTTASDFDDSARNIYEAILIMAQRARQINQVHHDTIEKMRQEYLDTMGDPDYILEPENEFVVPRFPKPTNTAIRELIDGGLDYHYPEGDKDSNQDDDETAAK